MTKTTRRTALHGTDTSKIDEFKKVFGPIRDAHLALAAMNRPRRIAVPGMTSEEVQTLAKKSGLDPKVVEQQASHQTAKMLREAEKHRAQAVKYSGTAKKLLNSAAAAWLNVGGVSTQGTTFEQFLLDTPFLIWPTPQLQLDSATIQPGNSIIRFHHTREFVARQTDPTVHEVSTFFRWTNPSDTPASISIHGYLIFSGTGQAVLRGGWMTNDVSEHLTVYGGVQAWGPSHEFLGGSPFLATPIYFFLQTNGLFYKHSVTQSASVFQGYDMPVDQFVVPANAEITLDLGLQIWEDAESAGSVDVDFLSVPDFSVTAIGIIITKWSRIIIGP